jgi:putative transposase
VVAVDPFNTSQACSQCGTVVPKDLSVRVHVCPRCGLALDRDVNAARNILNLALQPARTGRLGLNVGGSHSPCVS